MKSPTAHKPVEVEFFRVFEEILPVKYIKPLKNLVLKQNSNKTFAFPKRSLKVVKKL